MLEQHIAANQKRKNDDGLGRIERFQLEEENRHRQDTGCGDAGQGDNTGGGKDGSKSYQGRQQGERLKHPEGATSRGDTLAPVKTHKGAERMAEAGGDTGKNAEQVRRDVERCGFADRQVVDHQGHQGHRPGPLTHIQGQANDAPGGPEGTEDIGRTQIAAAVQPQVDALDLFADDKTEGNRTQSKGQQEEDYQQHGTVTSGCELNRDRPGCQ